MFKESQPVRNTPYEPSGYNATPIKRISWGAIIAGTIVALVVQMLLSLLGLGIGMGTIDPVQEANPLAGLGTGALIWWIASMLISLFAGGWVAGRLSGIPRNTDSILHGVLTWSLFTLVSFYLLTTVVGRIISGVGNVVGKTISMAGQGISAVAPEIREQVSQQLQASDISLNDVKQEAKQLLRQTGKPELQPENLRQQANQSKRNIKQDAQSAASDPQAAESEMNSIIDKMFSQGKDIVEEVDREAAINVVMKRTGQSRQEAGQTVDNWINTYQQGKTQFQQAKAQAEQKARQTGDDIASATSKAGIWGFVGLLLGAIITALGAWVGRPKGILVAANVEAPVYK